MSGNVMELQERCLDLESPGAADELCEHLEIEGAEVRRVMQRQ